MYFADNPMYDTNVCDVVRRGSGAAFKVLQTAFEAEHTGTYTERVTRALKVLFESEDPKRNVDLCGEQGALCAAAHRDGWQKIVDAAEAANDRSPECRFTTFIGYEYSGVKREVTIIEILFSEMPLSVAIDSLKITLLRGR